MFHIPLLVFLTIDDCEIVKFQRRALEWTAFVLARLQVNPPARVLFVESGSGNEVLALRKQGYDAWGIGMRPAVSKATRWYWIGDATNLPFATGVFEVGLALEVIEYIWSKLKQKSTDGAIVLAVCSGIGRR